MQLATSFTKDLPSKLSDDERHTRSISLARTLEEIADVEQEKSKIARQFAEKLKGLKLRSIQLAHAVSNGEENRPVLCSERADMRRFSVETYRHDSGETVDTRPMTSDEVEEARQMSIFPNVRVSTSANGAPKGALDVEAPKVEAGPANETKTAETPAEVIAEMAGDEAAKDEATITDPEGVLQGKADKPKRTRKKGLNAVLGQDPAPIPEPTPTATEPVEETASAAAEAIGPIGSALNAIETKVAADDADDPTLGDDAADFEDEDEGEGADDDGEGG